MKTIELTNGIGYKVYDDDNNLIGYKKESSGEGYVYKDYDAYQNNPDEICYLCEYCCEDTESDDRVVPVADAKKEGETANTIFQIVKAYFADYGEKMTDEQIKSLSETIFDFVDWDSIDTRIECYIEDREYFDI